MAVATYLDRMCLALRAPGLWLRYAALQNFIPSFPWIAPPPSTLAQSKERKGSNFAIWQPCPSSRAKSRQRQREGGRGRQLSSIYFSSYHFCPTSSKIVDYFFFSHEIGRDKMLLYSSMNSYSLPMNVWHFKTFCSSLLSFICS